MEQVIRKHAALNIFNGLLLRVLPFALPDNTVDGSHTPVRRVVFRQADVTDI